MKELEIGDREATLTLFLVVLRWWLFSAVFFSSSDRSQWLRDVMVIGDGGC